MESKFRTKRVRSINFSVLEKERLWELVSNKKEIIANTKTDAASNSARNKAWMEVALHFNATAPNGVYRSVKNLIKAYQNQKKKVRAEMCQKRLENRQPTAIGGAPSQIPVHAVLNRSSDCVKAYAELCIVQIEYYKKKSKKIELEIDILEQDKELKRIQLEQLKNKYIV